MPAPPKKELGEGLPRVALGHWMGPREAELALLRRKSLDNSSCAKLKQQLLKVDGV